MTFSTSMKKITLVLIILLVLNGAAFGGFWITTSIDSGDYDYVMPIIVTQKSICDYNPETGFLVDRDSEKYLKSVTGVPWEVLDKTKLQTFMDSNGMLYCFYGSVRAKNHFSFTEVIIDNGPIASTRFTGQFLCGGSALFYIKKRLPSILNYIAHARGL